MQSNEIDKQQDEIDLLELLSKIWKGRKIIIKFFIIFFLLGLIVAIFSPKQYTATTVVIPQSGSAKSGGIGGLAALAGINLGNVTNTENIQVSVYPKIVQSIPFQREMIKTPIYIKEINKEVSYAEYYQKYPPTNVLASIKKYTIGLPATIIGTFKPSEGEKMTIVSEEKGDIYYVTNEEKQLFGNLLSQIDIKVDEKEGIVTISFSMEEPIATAQMAQQVQNYLQKVITEFKIQKAKEKLDFIQKRYEEAEKDFKDKQIRLASFQDSNRGLISSLSQTRLTQLQSEYNLSFNLYSELAKQLESQKIQVKEDTPVFTIIEPVSVPLEKSKPKRGMIIAIWSFLGLVLGIGFIFAKDFVKNFQNQREK